jgi:hypothetical protein
VKRIGDLKIAVAAAVLAMEEVLVASAGLDASDEPVAFDSDGASSS